MENLRPAKLRRNPEPKSNQRNAGRRVPSRRESGRKAEESGRKRKAEKKTVDLSALSLAELSDLFDKLTQDDNRMKRYKEAEAIKSAFYRRLSKEKAEAGLGSKVNEPSSREDIIEEVSVPVPEEVQENPFEAIEAAFKGVYSHYKKERAEYNRQLDSQREENYIKKQAVIEDLKALLEKQEDVSSTFPAFRELQSRWREIGPVPATKFRNLNDTYQFHVETFYDMVKINRELRDLDFQKNLEVRAVLRSCRKTLRMTMWNFRTPEVARAMEEFGPVAKEFGIPSGSASGRHRCYQQEVPSPL